MLLICGRSRSYLAAFTSFFIILSFGYLFVTAASASAPNIWRWLLFIEPLIFIIAFRLRRPVNSAYDMFWLTAGLAMVICNYLFGNHIVQVTPLVRFFVIIHAILFVLILLASDEDQYLNLLLLLVLTFGSFLYVTSIGKNYDHTSLEVLMIAFLAGHCLRARNFTLSDRHRYTFIFGLCWVFWIFLTTTTSISGEDSMLGFIKYFSYFVFAIGVFFHFKDSWLRKSGYNTLLLVNATALLAGILHFSLRSDLPLEEMLHIRLWINNSNPTHAAQFFALILPIPLVPLLRLPSFLSWKKRAMLIALFAGNVFFLYMTYTRAAIVGGGLALLAFAIVTAMQVRIRRQWRLVLVSAALAIVIVPFALNPALSKRFKEFADPNKAYTGSGRDVDWQTSFAIMNDSPWMGHGLGTRAQLFTKYQPDPTYAGIPNPFVNHAHNFLLGMGAETGLPSIILFSTLLILIVGFGLTKLGLALAASCTILGVCFALMFGVLLSDTLLFFLTFLAIIAATSASKEKTVRPAQASSVMSLIFAVSALVLVYSHLFHFNNYIHLERDNMSTSQRRLLLSNIFQVLNFSSTIPYNLALLDASEKDFLQAKIRLEQGIENAPNKRLFYLTKSFIEERSDDVPAAISSLQRALFLGPHFLSHKIYLNLARLFLIDGDQDLATHYAKQSILYRPSNIKTLAKFSDSEKFALDVLKDMEWEQRNVLWKQESNDGEFEICYRCLKNIGIAMESIGSHARAADLFRQLHVTDTLDEELILRLIWNYKEHDPASYEEFMTTIMKYPVYFDKPLLLNEFAWFEAQRQNKERAYEFIDLANKHWNNVYLPNLFAMILKQQIEDGKRANPYYARNQSLLTKRTLRAKPRSLAVAQLRRNRPIK